MSENGPNAPLIGRDAEFPINGRAAMRTKMRGDRFPAVADPNVLALISLNVGDLASRETRLITEGTAGPPLAGIAVANRDPDGFAMAGQMQLPTGT